MTLLINLFVCLYATVLFCFKFLRDSTNFERFLQKPDLSIITQFSLHLTKANVSPQNHPESKAKNGQWFYVNVFSFLLEFYSIIPNQRDSHWRCFIKMLFLKYSENTHGESTCVGVLFNKIVGWRPATLLKGLQHRCFPVNSQKF